MSKKLLITGALVFASTVAMADGLEDFKPHFLAGIGVGQVNLSASDSDLEVSLDGHDVAFRAFGGYQFTSYISAELAYHNFGNVEDTIQGVTVGIKGTGFEGSVILSTNTVEKNIGAFARLGYVAWNADLKARQGQTTITDSQDGNDATFGGGVWAKYENALLRIEYTTGKFEDVDLKLISASIVWQF